MRLEGWADLVLRDASLRLAPQDEVEIGKSYWLAQTIRATHSTSDIARLRAG